jgi:hypothetical protein
VVDDTTLIAFQDELTKIAGIRDFWENFLDVFRSDDKKVQRKVDYQFSHKAGPDKWDKLVKNVRDQKFVDALSKHPDSDDTLAQHAQSMHDLSRGKPKGKVYSSRLPGRSYEIRSLGGDKLGCTCPDWRFKGSVNPGYECKHIRAHREGKVKAD